MPKGSSIEIHDEVLVRGEVVSLEADGRLRVRFPGYQYPITVLEHAVEQVFKRPSKSRPQRPDKS